MSETDKSTEQEAEPPENDIEKRSADPPIGWDGQTLREMLEETEQLTHETGHYRGLETLEMKEERPFEYEQLYSRLRGALVGARETALNISSSPIVKEIGELCFQVYTPEGDAVALSTGIIVHVHTGSTALKFMIEQDYEHGRGIEPGDIYCNNDQDMGNIHTADVHTFVPVFRDGELVAWVDGVTHAMEIGGIEPGQAPQEATSRYHDGYYITCEKIGEDDERYQDYLERSERSVRLPDFWDLDEKCRLAGCHIIRESIHEIIDDVGTNTFKQFMRESVEEGRQIMHNRVKERMFPGTYRDVSFHAMPWGESYGNMHPRKEGQWDHLLHLPVEMGVDEDGTLSMEMEGASAPGPHSRNAAKESMHGGLWVTLSQCLLYDGKVNDGSHFALDTHFPEGTVTNPQDKSLSYNASWGTLISSFQSGWKNLSRSFFARGFREEVMSGYGPTVGSITGFGKLEMNDQEWGVGSFDISCQGMGGGAVRDGLDWGYAMWNPETDMGDVEKWEFQELGAMHLARNVKPNTAGHGKYRGGSAWEGIRTFAGNKDILASGGGWGDVAWHTSGLHGGFPWATGYRLEATDTDLFERFGNQEPYPVGDVPIGSFEEDIDGDVSRSLHDTGFHEKHEDGDLMHWVTRGGPGYGDPLERPVEKVKEDVEGDIFTPDVVEEVYGVVGEYDEDEREFEVDEEATDKRREEIVEQRHEEMQTYEEYHESERETIQNDEITGPVEMMYATVFETSEEWAEEFREFWALDDEFEFDAETPPTGGM